MTASRPPSVPHGDGWRHGTLRGEDRRVSSPAARRARPLVMKVGGSLLSRPGWPSRLAALIATVDGRIRRIVVGGGGVVEGLRGIDRAAPQPPDVMHTLAIECMGVTARLVAAALGLPIVAGVDGPARVAVLDVPAWLGHAADPHLPGGWHVTSDSIAARVAAEFAAGLLLVKSVPPPPCPDGPQLLAALARAGWVDEYFPRAAAGLDAIDWAAWAG